VTLPAVRVSRPPLLVVVAGGGMELSGRAADPEVAGWLCPLIDDVHKAAVATEMTKVVLDVRRLEHANAALWRCLVYWVRVLRRDAAARYDLEVLAAPAHGWQIVGMASLRIIGADRLRVQEA
jgi:hypothetical protein